MLSRVRGSMVAAVVGDCIGEMFEGSSFVPMSDVLAHVKNIEDKKKKGAAPKLPFTDDTAMARSIAASLVELRSVNVNNMAARFAHEFDKEPCRGYGGNVGTVLKALGDPNLTDVFKPASQQFNGSGSYGNGGGMRIAPLGLFCCNHSLEVLKEETINVTRLTHSHPCGIMGGLLQSFAVHLALSLDNTRPLDTTTFLQKLLERLRPVEEELFTHHRQRQREQADNEGDTGGEEEKLPFCEKLELMTGFLQRDVDVKEVDIKLGTDVSALRSVPTAVYCFLKGATKSIPDLQGRSEVEQAILYAISLGGDTDTIATMAGAIAGAFYGLESVPQSWQDACEGVSDAIQYADKMVEIISAAGKS